MSVNKEFTYYHNSYNKIESQNNVTITLNQIILSIIIVNNLHNSCISSQGQGVEGKCDNGKAY